MIDREYQREHREKGPTLPLRGDEREEHAGTHIKGVHTRADSRGPGRPSPRERWGGLVHRPDSERGSRRRNLSFEALRGASTPGEPYPRDLGGTAGASVLHLRRTRTEKPQRWRTQHIRSLWQCMLPRHYRRLSYPRLLRSAVCNRPYIRYARPCE